MKTTRKPEKAQSDVRYFEMEYIDWPADGDRKKKATISEWENGEGFDVYLGDEKVELTYQETQVLAVLFAQVNILK